MAKSHRGAWMAAGSIMLVGVGSASAVAPTPAQMLAFQPKQTGVPLTTPTEAELATCKVELVSTPAPASGWVLKDARGNTLRKFVASKGAKAKIDVWSYYQNGLEAYREVDSNENSKADQYRWFGAGGMRWGVDVNEDGRIDGWKMISAEEVSQEVLKAIVTRDTTRFQALLINDAEIKALDLPAAEADKIKQSAAASVAKFGQAVNALTALNEKTQWLHLEVQSPSCIPAEESGGKTDLVKYKNASILYDNAGKTDWISLGEVVQVGRAWRLVSGPVPGQGDASGPDAGPAIVPAEVQPLIAKLQQVDTGAPKPGDAPATVATYNLARASVLEQIVSKVPAKDADNWVKQLADCLSAAAQNAPATDRAAINKLSALRGILEKGQPGSPLAGYVAYREISASYTALLQSAKSEEIPKVQEGYREKLKDFVTAFATAEDAPDAALQIGMVSEFMGKDVEAKNWYTRLAKDYASHPFAAKANGALRRLAIEGNQFVLAGTDISTGKSFDIASLKGQTVIVYYWASWNGQCATDFNKLSKMMKEFAGKGVALVTVNLDGTQADAIAAIRKADMPGVPHLHEAGGLESPLAVNLGVMVLPNLFLVDKTGKVVSSKVQISTLDSEVQKLIDAK